jgi:hypothetical protein
MGTYYIGSQGVFTEAPKGKIGDLELGWSKQIIVFAVMLLVFSCQRNDVLYVSPEGGDENPGTLSQPLASLQKAIELSRSGGYKEIQIRGGSYYSANIELFKADSGLCISAFPGEKPVLYGGVLIKDWNREGELWCKKLEKDFDVRYLTVNNEPRFRSRLPETGEFTHLNKWDVPWMSTSGGGWKIQPSQEQLTTLHYDPKDIGPWLNARNAEVTIFHFWDESQVGLEGIDEVNHLLHFSFPATHPPGAFADRNKRASGYVIRNVREGITKPGQWYYDKSNKTIYYRPFANENQETLNAVVPVCNNLVKFEDGARNIRIEGISFSTSSTPLVNPGYSAHYIDGTISGKQLKNIWLSGLTVQNHAGWGFRLEGSNISMKNCVVNNIGAGGIFFKGENICVDSCQIHDVGQIYNGAVGIQGGGKHNRISHCDIYNIPYCAIGGIGKNSIVSNCLMYNFKTFLHDGGAIYQFAGDSTVYRNNAAICDPRKKIEGWTYYFDERSKNCTAENNLALNTIVPMHNHMAKNILFRNNIFIDQGKQELSNYLCSDVIFEKNISIADSIYLKAPREGLVEEMKFDDSDLSELKRSFTHSNGFVRVSDNILHSRRQKVMHKELIFYSPYKVSELKPKEGTLFADPMFENVAEGNFAFKSGSPVTGMGIKQLDFSGVGCTGSFKRVYSACFKEQ